MDQPEKNNQDDTVDQHHEEDINEKRKTIESYSVVSLMCFIAAVILISFEVRLPAGCLVLVGAAIFVLIIRKSVDLIESTKDLFLEASESNRKKDDVITDFSHKIREPLNNLVSIADMLINSGIQKKQKDMLETFIASTNNMVSTVNELTMESAGNIDFKTRKNIRYNLLSTIQDTIELYNLVKNGKLDFILTKKDPHDFECFGDPIKLKQIFLDLFNIIESKSSDHIIKVAISLKKEYKSGPGRYISLRIQTDENILLIDENGTTGHLASKLITSGNGRYNQESGDNYSVLNILMPFRYPERAMRKQPFLHGTDKSESKTHVQKELKELNILIVEDNLINQKITLLALSPLVNNAETAANGKEALEKVKTGEYDLILMDIQMPVMNGLIAAENIRELEKGTETHVPIIAMTADALIGDMEKCLSAGIDEYISKPFMPDQLIEKIKKIL